MICRIVLGAMVVLTATVAADAVEADSLLDGTRVVPIEITLPAADWETLRRESRGPVGLFSAGPPQPFTYYRGHAVVDGLAIADVGVRKKGFVTTSLAAVRGFIRRRRDELSKALESWPPELPDRYRQPMTTRRVGTVSGSFATIQRESATGDSAPGEIALTIRLNGTAVAFEPTGVTAYPLPIPGPQGQATAPATPPRTPDGPIGVTISGTRPTGTPLSLTFMLDRRLLRDTTADVATGGMLTEGTGFFGTGPMRIVGGTAALTDRGSDPGSRLAGTFEFTVDETAGGFTNPAAKRRPIDTSRDDPDITARNNP